MATMAAAELGFAVRYVASGGGSGTDAELRLDTDGAGWMFLGSPLSLPPAGELALVGCFAGRPAARRLGDLAKKLSVLGAPEEPTPSPPGSVVRFLRVTPSEGRESEWAIPGYASEPVAAVESVLQQVMVDLLGAATAAVRLEVDPGGGLRLVAAGSEAVEISTPTGVRGSLVAWADDHTVLDTWPVRPPGATGAMVLAPGESLVLEVEGRPGGAGEVRLTGGIELDLRAGDRNRHVSVRTPAP
jgi:hypothetical protein